MVSELEFIKKWLPDFNAGETQLVSFDRSNNSGSIDVKMDGSVLDKKSPFKMLGLTLYCSNFLQEDWSFNSFYEVSFS